MGAGDLNSNSWSHLPTPTAKIWFNAFLDAEFSNSWHLTVTILSPQWASEQEASAMPTSWSSHSSHGKTWGSNSACSVSPGIRPGCTSSSWEILMLGPRTISSVFPGRSASPWKSSNYTRDCKAKALGGERILEILILPPVAVRNFLKKSQIRFFWFEVLETVMGCRR